MKQKILFAIILYALTNFPPLGGTKGGCQNIGINTTGSTPNASAMLDIEATDKGVLIPRVALSSTSSASPVTSPVTSLLVYNTAIVGDVTPGYYYWNGSIWISLNGDPIGTIVMYGGTSAPPGWLLCDGSAISRTTYANLFAVIGISYGAGDGSTTFNLPETRGRAPIGAGLGSGLTNRTLGDTGGAETHTLTIAEMPSHDHGTFRADVGINTFANGVGSQTWSNSGTTGSTGGSGAHNNMQPFWVPNFIIRY